MGLLCIEETSGILKQKTYEVEFDCMLWILVNNKLIPQQITIAFQYQVSSVMLFCIRICNKQ